MYLLIMHESTIIVCVLSLEILSVSHGLILRAELEYEYDDIACQLHLMMYKSRILQNQIEISAFKRIYYMHHRSIAAYLD